MGRELEVKLLMDGASWKNAELLLREELSKVASAFTQGSSIDAYWQPVADAKGSFLRLRVANDGTATLTSKVNDKGDITDRAEYEVLVLNSQQEDLEKALVATLGEPQSLSWRWIDYKIGAYATISAIQNLDDERSVFVEVEASTKEDVQFWVKRLQDASRFPMRQAKNSFYDIYVRRQGILL